MLTSWPRIVNEHPIRVTLVIYRVLATNSMGLFEVIFELFISIDEQLAGTWMGPRQLLKLLTQSVFCRVHSSLTYPLMTWTIPKINRMLWTIIFKLL
jgi:hypothetical protein